MISFPPLEDWLSFFNSEIIITSSYKTQLKTKAMNSVVDILSTMYKRFGLNIRADKTNYYAPLFPLMLVVRFCSSSIALTL